MGALNIDLTAIIAIWMGGLLLLVPMIGLTLRFGITPVLGALARYRRAAAVEQAATELRVQLAELERRLARVERNGAESRSGLAIG